MKCCAWHTVPNTLACIHTPRPFAVALVQVAIINQVTVNHQVYVKREPNTLQAPDLVLKHQW